MNCMSCFIYLKLKLGPVQTSQFFDRFLDKFTCSYAVYEREVSYYLFFPWYVVPSEFCDSVCGTIMLSQLTPKKRSCTAPCSGVWLRMQSLDVGFRPLRSTHWHTVSFSPPTRAWWRDGGVSISYASTLAHFWVQFSLSVYRSSK